MAAWEIVDEVAEGFLDMVDDLHDEIDELEDNVDDVDATNEIRTACPTLRHDLLHIRRTLAPTRDAVRAVVDDRVELDDAASCSPTRSSCTSATPTTSSCARARDSRRPATCIGGVRDYHQSKIANDQNEVMKRLTDRRFDLPAARPSSSASTARTSECMPELRGAHGYGFSWVADHRHAPSASSCTSAARAGSRSSARLAAALAASGLAVTAVFGGGGYRFVQSAHLGAKRERT